MKTDRSECEAHEQSREGNDATQGAPLATTRRAVLQGAIGAGLALAAGPALAPRAALAGGSGAQRSLTAGQQAILDDLMAGNARYVAGKRRDHDLAAARRGLTGGQQPKTAVIRCADSRVAPELVFDQSLGELFVCGVAGNIPTAEIMASIEYAVLNLGTELIVVMGHSGCGAVDATLSHQADIDATPGNLPGLLSQILPSVLKAQAGGGDKLARCIEQNARDAATRLGKMSAVVDDAIQAGKLGVASGVYQLDSGKFEVSGAG